MPVLETHNIISVPDIPSQIPVKRLNDRNCEAIQRILKTAEDTITFGVSFRLNKQGHIDAVALATPRNVFHVVVGQEVPSCAPKAGNMPLARVLQHPRMLLAGVQMPRLSLMLAHQLDTHVRAVDLSTLYTNSTFEQDTSAKLAKRVFDLVRWDRIHRLWDNESNADMWLRSWLCVCIAEKSLKEISKAVKIDSRYILGLQLACLSQLVTNVHLLEVARPKFVDGEIEVTNRKGKDGFELINARFKSRVRKSKRTVIEINGGKTKARAFESEGRRTDLQVYQGKLPSKVHSVRVVGREEATNAELACDEFLLLVLQGVAAVDKSPFVRQLWFPVSRKGISKKAKAAAQRQHAHHPAFGELNPSQRGVACALVAEAEQIVVVHGPPGTGKTRTISAALEYFQEQGASAWVIAHSNVGVKNIAEKLVKGAVDFKIIVSKEFHFEWHQHLYKEMQEHFIESTDLFREDGVHAYLSTAKIILCTVGMLSNPLMESFGVYKRVPVERLIVDEASQIDTLEFLHLFHHFRNLKKVCMFGDPKQLPPFGKEQAPKMKTIFDFDHLDSASYSLDTQYRMPVPLGSFISKNVYKNKLHSKHDITVSSCVAFVNVRKGGEQSVGSSWKNTEEVRTVANIAREYHRVGKKFSVITPYDPQRGALTEALKTAGLPHDDVYNVDSFQGHEADYIILSVVRTDKPGFLGFLNRMNVMLTRCKKGMVIVTQRAFLTGAGRHTLLGKLAAHWEEQDGPSVWRDAMDVVNKRAALPGLA